MAAEDIREDCDFWIHNATNANGYWSQLAQTNNFFKPAGILLPNSKDTRICFEQKNVIRQAPNAAHNGKIRVHWLGTAGSGTLKLFFDAYLATIESSSMDPASPGTVTGLVTDTPSGASQMQVTDFSVSSLASLAIGKWVFGVIERKALTDATDTYEADILIKRVQFVADV